MPSYILRRLILIVPTLFGIMLVNFAIIQLMPGGPVERIIARITTSENSGGEAFSPGEGGMMRGSRGLDPAIIEGLNKQFGFDKPVYERFFLMIGNYATFNFGDSYMKGRSVISLIRERLPVSISLGLWVTLLGYLISIPLGVRKAVKDGSRFDMWTSAVVIIGHALPAFVIGILLLILFAGSARPWFLPQFPLQGLWSSNWDTLDLWGKVRDYFWHLTLPLVAMSLGAFATNTLLTKNSFLDEIRKQYVLTARMKGLNERQVLYGHVFRNAMLIVIAGFPGAFIGAFFTGSLLIEQIFKIEGLGLLGFDAAIDRDYSVVLATLFIFSLMGLVVNLISDIVYMMVDPRIDFEAREA